MFSHHSYCPLLCVFEEHGNQLKSFVFNIQCYEKSRMERTSKVIIIILNERISNWTFQLNQFFLKKPLFSHDESKQFWFCHLFIRTEIIKYLEKYNGY